MAYKISGTVLLVSDTVSLPSKTGSTFTKRDLVIKVRKFDPYTGIPTDDDVNTPKFSFTNSGCQQLDGLKAGDIVTVHFDIYGRSYDKDGRTEYFTDLRPYKVEGPRQSYRQPQDALRQNSESFPSNQPFPPIDESNAPQSSPMMSQEHSDGLPF